MNDKRTMSEEDVIEYAFLVANETYENMTEEEKQNANTGILTFYFPKDEKDCGVRALNLLLEIQELKYVTDVTLLPLDEHNRMNVAYSKDLTLYHSLVLKTYIGAKYNLQKDLIKYR